MSDALRQLADACGIARAYHDIWGGHHPTSDSARRDLLAAMHFDLTRDPAELLAELRSLPKPPAPETAERCFQPAVLHDNGRFWGLSVQLYSLRSRRNWGSGDFSDLAKLVDVVASAGGDFIGLNPLHALFPDNPAHISPYSPSHRAFLNVLYIDVEAVPEFAASAAARSRFASADFQARLAALRATEVVDYIGVAQAKFEILPLLFDRFKQAGGARARAFADWRVQQGEALERFARYEALQAHFRKTAGAWGWPAWPQEFHDPAAQAVADFARTHADAVAYSAWLQWIAHTQLAAVAAHAKQRGMAIGLYQDLAVGANSGGAEVWSWQSVFAIGKEGNGGASTGAPPDELNLLGQDWGLPPFVPHRLRAVGYAPFIDILRANMKHAGALRIDHVMGLTRLFWVPPDTPATEGAYVHYPFEDMLGLVANESLRNACLVIGEDLGTVPDGFRERLFAAGVLSYHPLIFERYPDGQFRLPADMPRQALVAAGTHDLPTLAGFWRSVDLAVRTRLMLFPSDELRQRLITDRGWDRGRLLWALEREGLLPSGVGKDPAALPELTLAVIAAIHAYLARSPAMLLVVQPEDLFGLTEQINVPGTLEDQHPNWQRKLPVPIEDWDKAEGFQRCIAALAAER
jgi:(1->4)-alpha-D-glucan 1-alpha-D-glucosylmutase